LGNATDEAGHSIALWEATMAAYNVHSNPDFRILIYSRMAVEDGDEEMLLPVLILRNYRVEENCYRL